MIVKQSQRDLLDMPTLSAASAADIFLMMISLRHSAMIFKTSQIVFLLFSLVFELSSVCYLALKLEYIAPRSCSQVGYYSFQSFQGCAFSSGYCFRDQICCWLDCQFLTMKYRIYSLRKFSPSVKVSSVGKQPTKCSFPSTLSLIISSQISLSPWWELKTWLFQKKYLKTIEVRSISLLKELYLISVQNQVNPPLMVFQKRICLVSVISGYNQSSISNQRGSLSINYSFILRINVFIYITNFITSCI